MLLININIPYQYHSNEDPKAAAEVAHLVSAQTGGHSKAPESQQKHHCHPPWVSKDGPGYLAWPC